MRNNFYNRFKKFIIKEALCGPEDKILLAVSGGVDSVVMAHLFHRAGYKYAIAHCNFQLREKDSEADEAFVKELAKRLDAPFFVKKFDTGLYAVANGLSIQMAARELRYAWFDELLKEQHYNYLATAHHKDDVIETVILNLTKGSVLKGLHGILSKTNQIIRPLLFASKDEILEYATYKEHDHREDKSNADSKYQRNLIRNEVIPLLKQINPDIAETISFAARRRFQLEEWIKTFSEGVKKEIVIATKKGIKISIPDLISKNIPPEILFEWIENFGFNFIQVEELYEHLNVTESKLFLASEYRMQKDRKTISIEKTSNQDFENILIKKGQSSVEAGEFLFSMKMIHKSDIEDFNDPSIAYLDEEKIQFPLLVRKWEHGDSFKPFGLRGRKKISDYLTDLKLTITEKEKQLVVCSGNDICWVVGHRIDDRFKVCEKTHNVLKIIVSDPVSRLHIVPVR